MASVARRSARLRFALFPALAAWLWLRDGRAGDASHASHAPQPPPGLASPVTAPRDDEVPHRQPFSSGPASLASFHSPPEGSPPEGRRVVDVPAHGTGRHCPPDMVLAGNLCVDRWESSMVDKATGEALSPYYPPQPALLREVWQAWELDRGAFGTEGARAMPIPELSVFERTHTFEARALSRPGVVPQAYLAYPIAKRACESARKRLCTEDEWVTACEGERRTKFPYGDSFERSKCNVWGYVHPGVALHQGASFGHRDPRLNLLAEGGEKPLLRLTGATLTCASRWGTDAIYDMVGNVDEWVEGNKPEFVGGFYARSTSNGCESRVTNHAPMYYDYSIGGRCCRDPE